MIKILITLLTCVSFTPVMGATREGPPPVIYKNLQKAVQFSIKEAECDGCAQLTALQEKTMDHLVSSESAGAVIISFKCKQCEVRPLHERFIGKLGEISYNITEELEMLIKVQDQAVFEAYSERCGIFANPDYRKESVKQLKETFLRDFRQVYYALRVSRTPDEIREQMSKCLELLRRIDGFCEDARDAYRLEESKKYS
jgi:hypothetical protein